MTKPVLRAVVDRSGIFPTMWKGKIEERHTYQHLDDRWYLASIGRDTTLTTSDCIIYAFTHKGAIKAAEKRLEWCRNNYYLTYSRTIIN